MNASHQILVQRGIHWQLSVCKRIFILNTSISCQHLFVSNRKCHLEIGPIQMSKCYKDTFSSTVFKNVHVST